LSDTTLEVLGLKSHAELMQLREGVLFVLRHELRDRTLAEDLCNEAFRVVLERLQRQPLEDPSKLASYLAQTARFLARSHYRTARRHRTFTGQQQAIDGFRDPEADPSAAFQTEMRAKAVRRLLGEIQNVRDREVLVRLYLREDDKETICRELSITDDHFRRVVFRARERFRALVERQYRVSDLYCLALA
jgi:RNA polymerase sigma-70 factor (ECF subfamily)